MKHLTAFLLAILLSISCAAASLDAYKDIMLPDSPRTASDKKQLRVVFMGVATMLFDDGETAIMTEGYFSRPGRMALLSKLEPPFTFVGVFPREHKSGPTQRCACYLKPPF